MAKVFYLTIIAALSMIFISTAAFADSGNSPFIVAHKRVSQRKISSDLERVSVSIDIYNAGSEYSPLFLSLSLSTHTHTHLRFRICCMPMNHFFFFFWLKMAIIFWKFWILILEEYPILHEQSCEFIECAHSEFWIIFSMCNFFIFFWKCCSHIKVTV